MGISLRRLGLIYIGTALLLYLISGCATKEIPPEPLPPPPNPEALLSFQGVEAPDIDHLRLHLNLELENPRTDSALLSLSDLSFQIEGNETAHSADLGKAEEAKIEGGQRESYPLTLDLDMIQLLESGLPPTLESAHCRLSLKAAVNYQASSQSEIPLCLDFSFPLVRRPEFAITAIAIRKAELINTRFKVSFEIRNPNYFPLELSAFNYELYGAGRFWADGKQKNILSVPAGGVTEGDLFLIMNFINMKRDLLDQIIAMQHVQYRFTGEATVATGVDYLPSFRWKWDQSGASEVIE